MGLQSLLEHCAKNAIRPTFPNRSKNPPTSPSKYKGGVWGGDWIFVPLWQVHSLLELSERRAILSGTSWARCDTTAWNFVRSEQYFPDIFAVGKIRPGTLCVWRNTTALCASLRSEKKIGAPAGRTLPRSSFLAENRSCRRLLWLSLLLHQHCQISHAQPQACLILTKR